MVRAPNTPRRNSPALTRRRGLASMVLIGSWIGLLRHSRPTEAADRREPILQPPQREPKAFMAQAFAMRNEAERAGDQSFGAVVVRDGRIIGQAPSRVVVHHDPTAHAEMEAIRDAAARLGRRDLVGSTMFSSSRPCPMCEAAAYWAGIERMIHGQSLTDAGSPRLRRC